MSEAGVVKRCPEVQALPRLARLVARGACNGDCAPIRGEGDARCHRLDAIWALLIGGEDSTEERAKGRGQSYKKGV